MTVLRMAGNLATPQARTKRPTIAGLSAHYLSMSEAADYVTNVSTKCGHTVTWGRISPIVTSGQKPSFQVRKRSHIIHK